jgi:hypothetical protein
MTPTSIRAAIESLSFRYANTMPEIPHQYVVRSPDNEVFYVALFSLAPSSSMACMSAGRVATSGIYIPATVGNIGR